jgi:hypothetical protein
MAEISRYVIIYNSQHHAFFRVYLLTEQTLIAIRQLRGAHTGENQVEIIIEVIKDYNLQQKIGYFITDNAQNNDIAIEAVLTYFFPK